MSYKEIWQGYYETALDAGLCEEDAGCEANAKLADYESEKADHQYNQMKEDAFYE